MQLPVAQESGSRSIDYRPQDPKSGVDENRINCPHPYDCSGWSSSVPKMEIRSFFGKIIRRAHFLAHKVRENKGKARRTKHASRASLPGTKSTAKTRRSSPDTLVGRLETHLRFLHPDNERPGCFLTARCAMTLTTRTAHQSEGAKIYARAQIAALVCLDAI